MPRGGRRPGAGRPRKHPKPNPDEAQKAQAPVSEPTVSTGSVQPLEYMLKVMNDASSDPEIRARMAVAAAPYVHPKAGEQGKKELKNEAAKRVASRFGASAPPARPRDNTAH